MRKRNSSSNELVLILGAGFSAPANGPLLRDIPQIDTHVYGRDVLRAWLRADPTPGDLEARFSELWTRASISGSVDIGKETVEAAVLLDILQNHLCLMCNEIGFTRSTAALRSQYDAFFEEVAGFYDLVSIVSFNYDQLVEDTLDRIGVPWDYGSHPDIQFNDTKRQRGVEKDAPSVQLLKLHGSANWGICYGCTKADDADDVVTAFTRPYSNWQRSKSCPFCGKSSLRLGVVPPIYGKAGQIGFIRYAWAEAGARLRNAAHIMAIGYSLPKSDIEATLLLSEARKNPYLSKALLVAGEQVDGERFASCIPVIENRRCYFEAYLSQRFARGI